MSINGGMVKEDGVCVYVSIEFYSSIKRTKIPLAVRQMDLEIVIQSEVRQKYIYHMTLLICDIQINGTNEPIYKTEIESQM